MTEIEKIVAKAVQQQGVVPFAEFMRLALYCPNCGYYEQVKGRIGREGDFYTSVRTGSLFAELLAFQFAQWTEDMPGNPLQWVEAGAHDGQFAADFLEWLIQHRPSLVGRLQYWIIEPSPNRQAWQKERLEKFADRVRWFASLETLPPEGITGVIFSNELLDALPVHRLGWDAAAARWFEWGVAYEDDAVPEPAHLVVGDSKPPQPAPISSSGACQPRFVWKKMPRPPDWFAPELSQAGLNLPTEVLAVLPNEYTIEISPAARAWWAQAARALTAGHLITIDYGWTAPEFIRPERTGGTLRAYHRHHVNSELLERVGQQDLTAHVNFTQLQKAGEAEGLTTAETLSQERFLTAIATKAWQSESGFGAWTPARVRQFQTLTHPEHLGRPFSVFRQSRGMGLPKPRQ